MSCVIQLCSPFVAHLLELKPQQPGDVVVVVDLLGPWEPRRFGGHDVTASHQWTTKGLLQSLMDHLPVEDVN